MPLSTRKNGEKSTLRASSRLYGAPVLSSRPRVTSVEMAMYTPPPMPPWLSPR